LPLALSASQVKYPATPKQTVSRKVMTAQPSSWVDVANSSLLNVLASFPGRPGVPLTPSLPFLPSFPWMPGFPFGPSLPAGPLCPGGPAGPSGPLSPFSSHLSFTLHKPFSQRHVFLPVHLQFAPSSKPSGFVTHHKLVNTFFAFLFGFIC